MASQTTPERPLKPLSEGDPVLRADLHSVQKIAGPTGQVRLLAEESEDGHADRFWAAALMASAAASGGYVYDYQPAWPDARNRWREQGRTWRDRLWQSEFDDSGDGRDPYSLRPGPRRVGQELW